MTAITASVDRHEGAMTADERLVIFASSLGTVFEWYDFYIYGTLAPILAAQFFAGVVLLPLIPVQVPVGPITPTVVAMTLVLALVCSGAAYLLYYRLMSDIGPTRTLSVTFLIPLFAMVWGALFLSETITPAMVAGCALIVGGTVLVNRPSRALAAARRATTGRT